MIVAVKRLKTFNKYHEGATFQDFEQEAGAELRSMITNGQSMMVGFRRYNKLLITLADTVQVFALRDDH